MADELTRLSEQRVVGILIMDNSYIEKAAGKLEPDMFEDGLLGRIYLELLRAYDNHYDLPVEMLIRKVECDKYPVPVIMQEINECISGTQTTASFMGHVNAVLTNYKARRATEIISAANLSPDGIEGKLSGLIESLTGLMDGKKQGAKSLPDIVRENKTRYFHEDEKERLYIGFPKLDELLGGLEGGDMIVIGARPAVGKSAFVTQITKCLADSGKRVGFYNLEMQDKQVYERFVAALSGIGLQRLRRAKNFLGDEERRFLEANTALESLDNIIINTGSKKVEEIRRESRHMGYDVIIIDYLQLLRSDRTYNGNRTAEVGAISKTIKALAMELNIPIIALSQLNRRSELGEAKEPMMADLREAGDIEQDASIVMLMWNLSQTDNTKKGCKIEKNRQGQTGRIVLDFDGSQMRFTESAESIKEAAGWAKQRDDDCPFN